MSNHIISEVYKRRIGSLARTAVMVLLADKASDDGGGIWASKQRMADELGTTRQTVITTIDALTADGLLRVVGYRPCQYGYTVEYEIDVAALRALPLVPCHDDAPPAAKSTGNGTGGGKGTGAGNGTVQQSRKRDALPVRKREKASLVTESDACDGADAATRQAALRDPSSSFTPPVKQLYTNPPRTPLEPYLSDTSYPQGGSRGDPARGVSIYQNLTRHFQNLQPAAQLVRWEEAFAAIGRDGAALDTREREAWTEWLITVSEGTMDIPEAQHAQRLLAELADY